MNDKNEKSLSHPVFVRHLPDLMTPEDYNDTSGRKKIRIQIKSTEQGIEVLGDSMYPDLLVNLFSKLEIKEIETVLCG
jgi:hypothetical protein